MSPMLQADQTGDLKKIAPTIFIYMTCLDLLSYRDTEENYG